MDFEAMWLNQWANAISVRLYEPDAAASFFLATYK